MDQWRSDAESGKLSEAFACGTAAVVASIGEIVSSSGSFRVKNAQGATVALKLKEQLVGVQRGSVADSRGWVRKV
jgi:branched-chain amino acid aminotransferase